MHTPESKKGMWKGWSLSDLHKERARLKAKKEHSADDSTRLREVNFAIRAKTGFGSV